MTNIRFHKNDLPDLSHYAVDAVAIDTETRCSMRFSRLIFVVAALQKGVVRI